MLQSSINKGYKGVYFSPTSVYKPYRVEVRRCGKTVFLGQFATPEEAALCYARAAAALAASSRKRKAEPEEELEDAEEDDVEVSVARRAWQTRLAWHTQVAMAAATATTARQAEAEGLALGRHSLFV